MLPDFGAYYGLWMILVQITCWQQVYMPRIRARIPTQQFLKKLDTKQQGYRARLVCVFKNWKLLFKNICGNTCGWKSVLKCVKCCLKTKNSCLKTQIKHLLSNYNKESLVVDPWTVKLLRLYLFLISKMFVQTKIQMG